MDHTKALEYINDTKKLGIKPGAETTKRLLAVLGDPQNRLNAIHIAGTNGKGSTGAFIERGLIYNGYKVGRYFSPAVSDPRETLTVNGAAISPEEFAEAVTAVKNAAKISGTEPTSFEIETAAAFYWLDKKKCDITVIEAGMGGGLDATNTVKKILAVITPIAIDHSKFLGNTVEEIAQEKAGIITGAAVSSPQTDSVKRILEKRGDITYANAPENVIYFPDRTVFDYKNNKNINIPLLGKNQAENAALAIEALERLGTMGYNIRIENAFEDTIWHYRFEKLSEEPLVFADAAHNPHGALSLAENIGLYRGNRSLALVTGVLADKDYRKMAEIMGPLADKVYTVTPKSPRALSSQELCSAYAPYADCEAAEDIASALDKAARYEMIVIFGTFTIMNDVYEYYRGDSMYGALLNNGKFKKAMMKINASETDRRFCRHGIEHSLDVARIAYIIALEKGLKIDRDIIYTAALLHDIGRADEGEKHNVSSANAAREIMAQCGYDKDTIDLVASAILRHREKSSGATDLGDILSIADKTSRLCQYCGARKECRWKEENKNKYILR